MIARLLPAICLLAVVSCSTRLGVREADWERGAIEGKAVPREAAVTLPPYPREADLIEFFAGPTGSHRYFIDANALAVGADGIMRYTIVIRAAGGAASVSYEGMRCATYEKRTYALGQPGQKWAEAKYSDWEPIRRGQPNAYQATLYAEYFCRDRLVVKDKDTALRALRAPRGATRPTD